MSASGQRHMHRMGFEDGTSLLETKRWRGGWSAIPYRLKGVIVLVSLMIIILVISHTHVPVGSARSLFESTSKKPRPSSSKPRPSKPQQQQRPDTIPEVTITTLPAQYFRDHNARRVKIALDPISVPPAHVDDGMLAAQLRVPAPCGDCLVTWMQAGLEYADGSVANADSGMWFHHVVVANEARSQVSGCTSGPDRFFGSGNERTPVDLTVGGTVSSGYYVAPSSMLNIAIELMNMNADARSASPTITYEYIPGPIGPEFTRLSAIWLDAGSCSNSELHAVADGQTNFRSPRIPNPGLAGRIVLMGGHLHDGGTSLEIMRNGKVICETVAAYGETEAYVSPVHGGHDLGAGMKMDGDMNSGKDGVKSMMHLSSMSNCKTNERLSAGDELSVIAHYDTSLHAPMKRMDGSLEGVMGISILYVAPGL